MIQKRFKSIVTLTLLAILFVPGIVIGGLFLTSPARNDRTVSWVQVTNVAALPEDGTPRDFFVAVSGHDAWSPWRRNTEARMRVFVSRDPSRNVVRVLEGAHRHGSLRIPVMYDAVSGRYRSCCWKVEFDLEGREIRRGKAPPLNDEMQGLPMRIDNDQVFVSLRD